MHCPIRRPIRGRTVSAALLATTLLAIPAASSLQAQYEWTSGRPDGHAPLGVMGDHVHETGEFMLSYRFMHMTMDGNRTGTEAVTPATVLQDFMVTPISMPMVMHMVGGMYAPSDRVTLMAMVPYVNIEMDHQTRPGGTFTTEGSGLGDVGLSALIGLQNEGAFRAHLHAGFSVPTGSIEIMDATPMSSGNDVQLPYPMQLGSGTFDLKPGITALWMNPDWSGGAQGMATLRMGENDHEYTLGNRFEAGAWVARKLTDWASLSVRGLLTTWGDIEGQEPAPSVNPMVVPTARTDLRGGTRLDIPFGLNLYAPSGALAGHRIAVEFNLPVYQDLNGPQLETDGILMIGWQKSFN